MGSRALTGERGLRRRTRRSAFDCEYLVGDDSCGAVKETDMGALRAEACRNEVKDACCYLCNLRRECDIGCDLPRAQRTRKESKSKRPPERNTTFDVNLRIECGNCIHYLKPKCPRRYGGDTELWRRQDPCEIFEPAEKGNSPR